ncbi:MinD/ParA family ATP-binding protein [Sinomonas atrocyanea]|uniref:MinD/ParA family ATP-binding protein n=1 Tax=Sinomonas atrocyanea TaxID=37927 RepID=UPI003D994EE8
MTEPSKPQTAERAESPAEDDAQPSAGAATADAQPAPDAQSTPDDVSTPEGEAAAAQDVAQESAADPGSGEEPAPVDVVTVADAQDRTSAESLTALTALATAPATVAVPPVPTQPPGQRDGHERATATAAWLAQHPLVTAGPGPAAPEDPAPGFVPTGSPDEAAEPEQAAQVSERRARAEGPEPAASLTSDRLVTKTAAPPASGWRRWLYYATLGSVNVGDSDAVRLQRALERRIAVRLGDETRYVPVLSRKGGVGKTTVTTLLGMALADLREDRVIAMDANPDRGTLSDRNPGRATHTARQLVKDRFEVNSFTQLSSYTAREGSRLDVLASDSDPMVAHAFNDADYRAVTDILGRYYSIVLTDSGTGMVHSVMQGTLEKADAVVLVSGGSVDEARLASETLSWLEAHGRDDLVQNAIVVVNMSAGDGTRVNVDEIEDHFRTRVRDVVRIPHDRHLAEGSQVDFAKLRPATREAAVELAALVVERLAAA